MGLERLLDNQRPLKALLLNWIGIGEVIRQQNKLVNQRCRELIKLLTESNQRYCILKGQGNAMMYSNPYGRNAGDIDVWLDGGKKGC